VKDEMDIKKALTIAGSDSGGGAGIQADLKTFAALGVYGSSVITAITAQNTLGVINSAGITTTLVDEQLDAVLGDIGADAIKTGMLYDDDIIEVIVNRLKYYKVPCLVVDPVMVATSGDTLLDYKGIDALRDKLLPQATFLTPNREEASVLCGFDIDNENDLPKAAREIHRMGADFVIITGIQQEGQCIDFCYDGFEFNQLKGPLIDTANTHGTGCSFSAALTAYIARGASPWTAVNMAKKYAASGLRYAYPVGKGRGPLNHLAAFYPGKLDDPDILETRARTFNDWGNRLQLKYPLLNVIIGGPLCEGQDYAELTRMAVENGAGLIQLREKDWDTRQLVDMAIKMARVCHEHGALFVVNDRVDVAAASDADGVHIGQDDLNPHMARALLGPEKIIGISAGNITEALAAAAGGADYLGVGPVYPTTSKDCRIDAGGPELVAEIAARVPIPIVAIGGITTQNTPALLKAGAAGVAVISSILAASDPAKVIKDFMKVIKSER
jgi:hydroxymethylpyrimidine kinase/phosphomethylpyrimidine kinase/thiamine-phosphate diphosphorylase